MNSEGAQEDHAGAVGPLTEQRSQWRSQCGWYSRGYLPHLNAPGLIQALTFRLEDSLPKEVVARMKARLNDLPETEARIKLHRAISRFEDAGHGSCLLRNQAFATIVQNALLHFDGKRYRLLHWVVMPNHVHVLLELMDEPLPRIVKSWKSFTARQINLARKMEGSVWAREYHDRFIRDADHYENARAYIRQNPVKAGLCEKPEDWPFSSASTGSAAL